MAFSFNHNSSCYKIKSSLKSFFSLIFTLCFFHSAYAQIPGPEWDNTVNKNWGNEFALVQIPSSADGVLQKAWVYKSTQAVPQPLIISLHTWSGDYSQEDPLAKEILLRDWNYIHPDFRGANNRPEACGSPLVLSDISDAIQFAIKNSNVDTTNVHIIGVSGGGYLTLLCYMLLDYPVKSFNAWAPISDLENWYWESKGRKAKYTTDIEQVAAKNGIMNWEELKRRSPINYAVPVEKRRNSFLNIYEGVHDGFTGSVPISHSFTFYNKIAAALQPLNKEALVQDSLWKSILIKRCNPKADSSRFIGDRMIQIERHCPNVSLTIFEGSHEMIDPIALSLLPLYKPVSPISQNIFTIGDSNGAFDYGWPQQLKKLLPYATIINKSVAGNTIGFDNLDRDELNTLKNIDRYLVEAYDQLQKGQTLDYILIGLGTNDTKTVFKNRQKEVNNNMQTLLNKIKGWHKDHSMKNPEILIITPSPIDEQKINKDKYGGGSRRVVSNNKIFQKLAINNSVHFLNTWPALNNNFQDKTTDGIHLNANAQFELASLIQHKLHSLNTALQK